MDSPHSPNRPDSTADSSARSAGAARDPRESGPLDRATALTYLGTGDRLLAEGDFQNASAWYGRVIGFEEPAITAAALLGLGNCLYRLDHDDQALATWRSIVELGPTPSVYPAWRQIAAALVRDGDLNGARKAYREAQRLAPPEDRAEIATRLGWLAKETGDTGAARRYFAQGRGGTGLPMPLSYLIIAVTVIVSLTASTPDGTFLMNALDLDKVAVAQGEWWRLLTVALVHAPVLSDPLHLLFNMYALFLVGPLVEQIYGWRLLGLMYVLCAAAGSMASFVTGDPFGVSVGASGAIFGLFGIVFAASRIHHPVLDRQGRAMVGQIGFLIAVNLFLGFSGIMGNIDNAAHIGGLLSGLWLGFVLVPGNARTLRDLWQVPAGTAPPATASDLRTMVVVRVLAVAALVVVIFVGLAVGSDPARFRGSGFTSSTVAGSSVAIASPVAPG